MSAPNPNAAKVFRQLHESGLLILANAWDAGSARLVESLGAKAVATTSAGVAWCRGYADGDALPVSVLKATVAEIARLIRVPLTVDMEGGYSNEPTAVGDAVAGIIEAGAVGINLEDGTGTPELFCAKVEQAKRAGARLGVELFVNARTDVYLRGLVPGERRVEETLARARRYRDAGADGLFVPGLADPVSIKAIASEARMPLNVMAVPGLPSASELEALGVRRLSAGAAISKAVFGKTASLSAAFLRDGRSEPLNEGAMAYPELNALMTVR